MLQNCSRDLILVVIWWNKYKNMCACLSAEYDPQSMILLRGHGQINIYNDNNYTSSLKRFQQRNGWTSVSLLTKHFIWIIYHMTAEAAAGDTVFMLIRSK